MSSPFLRPLRNAAAISAALSACSCGGPGPQPAHSPAPPTTEQAFASKDTISCNAVRAQTEPDLMAWDPSSRMSLSTLRTRGVVAVRYRAEGCNVELELLPNCIGDGKYEYAPYAARDTKLVTNAQELFAQLPLGAARLAGKLKGTRALRTDYVLAGQAMLPPGAVYKASDLRGPDCDRATHVVSRLYLGGFGMVSGESSELSAEASVFGVGAGGQAQGTAERVATEGNPAACEKAQESGEEQRLCNVPLRLGLLAVEGKDNSACPKGTEWDGARCVRREVVNQVQCPAGTTWDGTHCNAKVSTDCPAGTQFQTGQGCVATVSQQCPAGTSFETGRGCVAVGSAGGTTTPAQPSATTIAKTRVQKALSRARASLARCFDTTDPDRRAPSAPQVKATFDHKTGKVTAADLSTSSGVAELDACLLHVVRRISFEPLGEAGITRISFKIPRGN